ncbi:TPR-like protein [Rhizoctonia solani]|uniref:TPR-like protein n=1 Tax=Rhizoctonia solani TaxID=456999 RepID=A0A8H7I8E4_9AGAM|nr:TPR-like protein [Rhizoctonia solani]
MWQRGINYNAVPKLDHPHDHLRRSAARFTTYQAFCSTSEVVGEKPENWYQLKDAKDAKISKIDTALHAKETGESITSTSQQYESLIQKSNSLDPREHYKLGEICHSQYHERLQLIDIDNAITYMSRAITFTSDYDPSFPDVLGKLAAYHSDRFQKLEEQVDNDKTVQYLSRSIALTPADDPNLLQQLNNLLVSLNKRLTRLGETNDIEKLIEHTRYMVALTPDGDPWLPARLTMLAQSYKERYTRLGESVDINKSIEYQTRAVRLTSDNHPLFLDGLTNLGVFYRNRYELYADPDDLANAMEYATRSVALTPGDHLALPERLANLGMCYGIRFKRKGELVDNDKAIEHMNHAVSLAPDDFPDLPGLFINLGVVYGARFNRLGELGDLDKAIESGARAVALTPDGHPRLPERLANLGVSYSDRFKRLAESGDIDKAIKLKSRAIALTPDGDPHLPYRLGVLGASYHDRFSHQGSQEDLDNAIGYKARAVELTPDGHSELSGRLAALGASYGERFKLLKELSDIEKSIEYLSRAVILTPEDDPHLLDRQLNLGIAYNIRYRSVGRVVDLEKAIEHTSHALALAPEDHPIFPVVHHLLAVLCVSEYRVTDNSLRLQDALCSYRKASQSQAGSPRGSSLNVIEAYQTAIDILPQYIWLGATTDQRYRDMEGTKTLPAKAPSAAIAASNYELALEWLEHARCVVWNQSLMLRSPLDELRSSDQTLADRLQEVTNQLYFASSRPRVFPKAPANSLALEQASQQHRRLAEEYNRLMVQVRKIPGFDDFLRPIKADGLFRAARNGPIVVINCYRKQCDALIIIPGQTNINHIPLSSFTEEEVMHARSSIKSSLWHRGFRERGFKVKPVEEHMYEGNIQDTLAALWNGIVKPVLEFLGYLNDNSTNRLPHITWCPTGIVSFLPLHAAGDYNQPRSRVFDYAVSSYTPTLKALLTSNPSTLCSDSRVLAISQEFTSGCSALPGTAKELKHLHSHTKNKVKYTQLVDEGATTTAVLDAMEQHDWVHLACHAHQNLADPTKSGFFLHDGTLDLSSINRRSFKNKGLAFLSACQTAMGDEQLPDEAVHLASGMLTAGYPSVIATMWSVKDDDAPLVADKVYDQLMKGGKIGNGEAGTALHHAVAALREKIGENEFERWVPYIHIGS